MKRKHEGDIKAFSQLSRAYYGSVNLQTYGGTIKDIIYFGFYSYCGGTSGEMSVRWELLSGEYVPKIQIYSDAWSSLSNFHDLIDLLGKHDNEDPTPEEFCKYLLECGFVDITEEREEVST